MAEQEYESTCAVLDIRRRGRTQGGREKSKAESKTLNAETQRQKMRKAGALESSCVEFGGGIESRDCAEAL
jgi:hypothetical protein